MLLVIRLTTAGVMARAGLTVDILDDLKMSVEEACYCLITHTHCGSIHVSYRMAEAN
jgi:anti-sigma regulatory factor (Ser/Thr protein kinase)